MFFIGENSAFIQRAQFSDLIDFWLGFNKIIAGLDINLPCLSATQIHST
jgi:hypothetical protein